MRTEYRNAIKSKVSIKNAFIQLLKVKPASKITVTDIIQIANISRGTFYAHYKDTLDLWESFQRDFLDQLIHFTEKHKETLLVDKIDLLLNKTIDILKNDYETYCVLANQDFSFDFYHEVKRVILRELTQEYAVSAEIERSLNIYIGGFIMLLREWLENPNFESMEDYVKTLSRLIHQGTII
ncbi:TetR/AcrR family transcriptional regulator [Candidatus Stoquefichus sp. SB1]|jgi:AcrR family transcriptional regulator|uniref:TetR/AcrR family transcriptional regulator n=1 Tax=Candidatus Stoquefichus sp. SB1 TaxID=1658109 RepID=UPI00067ED865|nr:TetR/AcrR family transcriptional regulator [Candidatus Stoquefichus sp. SB1]